MLLSQLIGNNASKEWWSASLHELEKGIVPNLFEVSTLETLRDELVALTSVVSFAEDVVPDCLALLLGHEQLPTIGGDGP